MENTHNNILWFDIESSDLPVHKARIISISFIFNGNEKTLWINPMVPINPNASRVNKIYDKDVINWHPFSYYAPSIINLLNQAEYYGGYNNRTFDLPLLYIELLRNGYEMPDRPVIDVYESCQSLFKSLRLKDIYRTIFKENFDAHISSQDIKATEKLYKYIQEKLSA